MKSKEAIKEVLKDCIEGKDGGLEPYEYYLNEGWIAALKWVLKRRRK